MEIRDPRPLLAVGAAVAAAGVALLGWALVARAGAPSPSGPPIASFAAPAAAAAAVAPEPTWKALAPAGRRAAARAYLAGPGRTLAPQVSVEGILVQANAMTRLDPALARWSPRSLVRLAASLGDPETVLDARTSELGPGLVGRPAPTVADRIGAPDVRLARGGGEDWYYDTGASQWRLRIAAGRVRAVADITSPGSTGAAIVGWPGSAPRALGDQTISRLPAGPTPEGPDDAATRAARWALAQVGTPYVWGGANPGGFDCSGLVQWAYRQVGVSLPRVAAAQAQVGEGVPWGRLRVGDAVFFADATGYVHHEGLYVGDGRFVDAPHSGALVRIDSLSDPHYAAEYAGARRFVASP